LSQKNLVINKFIKSYQYIHSVLFIYSKVKLAPQCLKSVSYIYPGHL